MVQKPAFSSIPEIRDYLVKYGCGLSKNPTYVIIGEYHSKSLGPMFGILAASMNEFHAHLILKQIRKSGRANIERTEYHENPSFSIAEYKRVRDEKFRKIQENYPENYNG